MKQRMRQQILEDLGLVPWRLRADADRPPVQAPLPEPTPAAKPLAAQPSAAPSPPASQSPASTPTPPHAQPTTAASGPVPWTALSLALPGMVMLVDGAASQRDLRLAMDVLATAAGNWNARPASRRFDWPPPVAAPSVATSDEAARRALAAFTGKDVVDHGAALVLCVASLAQRLPADEPTCRRLVVPDLGELGRDPAAKRDLWRELAGLRP
jgi:hypothetical protein